MPTIFYGLGAEKRFDRDEPVEILGIFADIRLELNDRGLLEYRDGDTLYDTINKAEEILRDLLSAKPVQGGLDNA